MEEQMTHRQSLWLCRALLAGVLAGCSSDSSTPSNSAPGIFASNPCTPTGTLSLSVTQVARIDCSAGGTTLTLAGNGASYLIVPQFATNLVVDQPVDYTFATGDLAAASLTASRVAALKASPQAAGPAEFSALSGPRPGARQQAFEQAIFARAKSRAAPVSASLATPPRLFLPPALGSTRTFRVLSNFTASTWTTITAQLAYLGNNIYLYIDTASPADGFTPSQLTAFGQLFDQTLYGIDIAAFGQPSDIDGNGHVIMLMSPKVNGDTPTASCETQGYVAGFFDSADFDGPSDPNSNQGEVFYSVVPDPTGTVSCTHSVADLENTLPATFLHELQHLINYSQHVVVNHVGSLSSWLDEGMSIVAEELGSLYYEQKCPPPACRTSPTQLFPDSSQAFISGFFDDSYAYAILPDTASLTLHSDSDNGFSWRGGDWLLVRYLTDQYGANILKLLEQGPADGLTSIVNASGQAFPALFSNFGLALYTDSFPGMPRATAPTVNRFLSRNLRQLWARLYATAGPSSTVPLAMPLVLFPITTDTTTYIMNPGAMSFWRLDTPASSATVSIRFAAPGGGAFSSVLQPQIAVFRLPAGQ
jgi:hypothetical protein